MLGWKDEEFWAETLGVWKQGNWGRRWSGSGMKGFDRVFGCFGQCVGRDGVSCSCSGLEEGVYLDFM